MSNRDEFIQRVTEFLAARKSLAAGVDAPVQWVSGRQSGEHCVKLPIDVAGVQRGEQLTVVFVPGRDIFAINLIYAGLCVTRLDYDAHGGHTNGFVAHLDNLPAIVGGAHIHRWEHNIRFFDAPASLLELRHAQDLPTSIRNFSDSLRFFCSETNIDLPHGHFIELPRLLL